MQRYFGVGSNGGGDMKIREGAYYRTRSGDVAGPMRPVPGKTSFCWEVVRGDSWTASGAFICPEEKHDADLISEVYVSDTPPHAPLPDIITDQLIKTLRDEFAMRLMDRDAFMVGYKEGAEHFYRAADAMMDARKK